MTDCPTITTDTWVESKYIIFAHPSCSAYPDPPLSSIYSLSLLLWLSLALSSSFLHFPSLAFLGVISSSSRYC